MKTLNLSWNIVSDGVEVTSGGWLFRICGPATENSDSHRRVLLDAAIADLESTETWKIDWKERDYVFLTRDFLT